MSNGKVTSGITSFSVLVLVIKNYRNKELALGVLHRTNVIGIFVVVVLNSQQATRPHSKIIGFQERQHRGETRVFLQIISFSRRRQTQFRSIAF